MVLYRPLIDSLVSQTAKTTPLPERRSRAWEAFCEALNTHTAGQGIDKKRSAFYGAG